MPKIGKAKEHPDKCACYACKSEASHKSWNTRYQNRIRKLENGVKVAVIHLNKLGSSGVVWSEGTCYERAGKLASKPEWKDVIQIAKELEQIMNEKHYV